MNIIIFAVADFPVGDATSSRLRLISKCLISAGHNVELGILNAKTKQPISQNKIIGTHDLIKYQYLSKNTVRPDKFLGAFCDTIKGMVFSISYLFRKLRRSNIDAIILYTPNFIKSAFCIFFCKLTKIPLFTEHCEVRTKSIDSASLKAKLMSMGDYLAENLTSYVSDGLIVISTQIRDFYIKKRVKKIKIFHLPVLVDIKRFKKSTNDVVSILKEKKYILNSGTYAEKEGVQDILKAFSKIDRKHKDVLLVFTGKPSGEKKEKMLDFAKRLNIYDRVLFTGFVSNKELLWCYHNASGLICCRSNSEYANFGFPTKLGEYLVTGKPIIATKTGDIGLYIKNGRDAYLSEPGDVESITKTMNSVLMEIDTSKMVGNNGKIVAEKIFDYKNHIDRLDGFLRERIEKNNTDKS